MLAKRLRGHGMRIETLLLVFLSSMTLAACGGDEEQGPFVGVFWVEGDGSFCQTKNRHGRGTSHAEAIGLLVGSRMHRRVQNDAWAR